MWIDIIPLTVTTWFTRFFGLFSRERKEKKRKNMGKESRKSIPSSSSSEKKRKNNKKSADVAPIEKKDLKPSTTSGKKVKRDKSKSIANFLSDVLPSLRKEMARKTKAPFSLADYSEYFKPDSKYIPTYILPLFRFLEKNTVMCTRYGVWEGKHQVHTLDGFDRVQILSKNLDQESFPPDIQRMCTMKYGKEWFKIPAKDGFRAKAACANGFEHRFTITLTGVYTDSFIDKKGQEVLTINPTLTYDAALAPAPKKERKQRKTKEVGGGGEDKSEAAVSESEEDDEEEEEDDGNNPVSPIGEFPGVGAQDQPIIDLEDDDEEGQAANSPTF
jgi:hypothetical protein